MEFLKEMPRLGKYITVFEGYFEKEWHTSELK
jgi:hypothetical protein